MTHSIRNRFFVFSIVIVAGILTSCGNDALADILPDEISSYCIWDKSPHCAFTDLAEYNGKVYCCFREATSHVPENSAGFGSIRILETTDGEKWESIGTISDPNYDLRDPKLSVTPDGRLMLLFGRYLPDSNSTHARTCAKFISDEELAQAQLTNGDIHEIVIEGNPDISHYWLWRIKWIDGRAFGVAYKNGQLPLLVKSSDGINYTIVSVLDALGNEADIELLPDGRMLIVMRAQDGDGFVGTSNPPFDKWEWQETSTLIHCPAILTVDGVTYIAGRSTWGTMLFTLVDHDIHTYALLPSEGGDNAYPGIVFRNNELWISYYGASDRGISVFLSKISLNKLLDGK